MIDYQKKLEEAMHDTIDSLRLDQDFSSFDEMFRFKAERLVLLSVLASKQNGDEKASYTNALKGLLMSDNRFIFNEISAKPIIQEIAKEISGPLFNVRELKYKGLLYEIATFKGDNPADKLIHLDEKIDNLEALWEEERVSNSIRY